MIWSRKQQIAVILKLKEKGLLGGATTVLPKSVRFAEKGSLSVGGRGLSFRVSQSAKKRWGDNFSRQKVQSILQEIPRRDQKALQLKGVYVVEGPELERVILRHMMSSQPPSGRADILKVYEGSRDSVLGAHIRGRIFLNTKTIGQELKGPELLPGITQKRFDYLLKNTLLHEVGHNLDAPRLSPGFWRKHSGRHRSSDEKFMRAITGRDPGQPFTDRDKAKAKEHFADMYAHWVAEGGGFFKLMEKNQSRYRAFRELMEKGV